MGGTLPVADASGMTWKVVAAAGWAAFTAAVAAASALQVEARPAAEQPAAATETVRVMAAFDDLDPDPDDLALPLILDIPAPAAVAAPDTAPVPAPTPAPAAPEPPTTMPAAPAAGPAAPAPTAQALPGLQVPPVLGQTVDQVAQLVEQVLPGSNLTAECLDAVATALPRLPVVHDLRQALEDVVRAGAATNDTVVAAAADCLEGVLGIVPPIAVAGLEVDLGLLPGLVENVAGVVDLAILSGLLGG